MWSISEVRSSTWVCSPTWYSSQNGWGCQFCCINVGGRCTRGGIGKSDGMLELNILDHWSSPLWLPHSLSSLPPVIWSPLRLRYFKENLDGMLLKCVLEPVRQESSFLQQTIPGKKAVHEMVTCDGSLTPDHIRDGETVFGHCFHQEGRSDFLHWSQRCLLPTPNSFGIEIIPLVCTQWHSLQGQRPVLWPVDNNPGLYSSLHHGSDLGPKKGYPPPPRSGWLVRHSGFSSLLEEH